MLENAISVKFCIWVDDEIFKKFNQRMTLSAENVNSKYTFRIFFLKFVNFLKRSFVTVHNKYWMLMRKS